MSGNKRDQRASVSHLTRKPGGGSAMSLQDFAAAGYGTLDLPDSVASEPIPIYVTRPDPTQPRRTAPSSVRVSAEWNGNPDAVAMHRLYQVWFDTASAECGEDLNFDLDEIDSSQPMGQEEIERELTPQHAGYITEALVEIVALAIDIKSNGLIYPISVAGVGDGYEIEDGEARWFAYHYLCILTGDTKWEKIPAIVQQQASAWRQSSGNNVRRGLAAIAKARQYAKLMMAAYQERAGATFKPFHSFEHERQFYSQVLDEQYKSAPYGLRPRILRTMGLKSSAELTFCRTLLGLPDTVWTLGDDLRASQAVLLECASLSEVEAVRKLQGLGSAAISGKKSTGKGNKEKRSYWFAAPDRKRFSLLSRMTQVDIEEMTPEDKTSLVQQLQTMKERLLALEKQLLSED